MRAAYATDPVETVVAAACAIVATVALLLALLTLDRLPAVLSRVAAPVAIFDIPPPLPPPPPAVATARTAEAPARPSTNGRRAGTNRPDPGAGRPRVDNAPPDTTASIQPVSIAPPPPIPSGPAAAGEGAAATGTGDGGEGDGGAGRNGAGSGASGPSEWGRTTWVRPPMEADFLREWPIAAGRLAIPAVDVSMLGAVRKGGRPYDCKVVRESVRGKGFGRAAIRLTGGAIVRPATRDGVRTKPLVIVTLTFERVAAKSARADATGGQ